METRRHQTPVSSFRAQREIFVIRGLMVDVWSPKREACHQETFGHRRHLYSTALLYFYVPHHHFSFLISHSSEAFNRNQGAVRSKG